MSVTGLATTLVNVYSVVNNQDQYAANSEQYALKYKSIPARFRQKIITYEKIVDGKIQNISLYRIYIGYQYNILTSDLIVDTQRTPNRKYDIVYVNRLDRKHHLQIDCKRVDSIINVITYLSSSSSSSSSGYESTSSSSSDNLCPNTISKWTGSVWV
jgi:hypothetical protein